MSNEINQMFKDVKSFKQAYESEMLHTYGKTLDKSNPVERYIALTKLVEANAVSNWKHTKDSIRKDNSKQLYYFSLEFLMGRMLTNNLMNMGIYDICRDGLHELGYDINEIEDLEADAGLGNGGLGRLAACFLDSLACLDLPGNGNTIRYKNGLFKQLIVNNKQVEVPDQWLKLGNPWELRKPEKAVEVKYGGYVEVSRDENGKLHFNQRNYDAVLAVPYDMPIVGTGKHITNTLRMWSPEPADKIADGEDYRKYLADVEAICLNLYPDDSTEEGKMLRVKQEYFFVCAGIHSIVEEHYKRYKTLDNLGKKVAIQLNDTHPAMAVAELMRVMLDDFGYEWADAWKVVHETFAYTNHTVLAEALEKWPIRYIQTLCPRVYMIIEEINRQFINQMRELGKSEDFISSTCILFDGNVRMANLSVIGSHSVNGVAKIHSEIIKHDVFKNFYSIWPEKFNNKTNGITQRRWLIYSNPELSDLISECIGDEWKKDFSKIEDLMKYVDDKKVQDKFIRVKTKRKKMLAEYLNKRDGIVLDPNSLFDVQAKRLHAYKRQLLNILYVIHLYHRLKEDPNFTIPKTTFIFGAKAAPAYYFAKDVIYLINCVGETIRKDEHVSKFLDVQFIPNYCVSVAEKLMNAADVSEQISTAGKEASGTGNMKFMMNGAVTLGTMDGANVEINELVGDDNSVIFGLTADEVVATKPNYHAYDYYLSNPAAKQAIDSLLDGTFNSDRNAFRNVADEFLVRNDEYLLLADFNSYMEAHDKVFELYQNKHHWAKMCLVNIAKSAKFSSDRTISEYAKEIWDIKPIK